MSAELRIELHGADESRPRLEVAGEIDMSNVERLRRSLAVGESDGSPLTVDLNQVTYMDSAGVSALFARARCGGLQIVAAPGSVAAPLIRITRLDQVAEVRPS